AARAAGADPLGKTPRAGDGAEASVVVRRRRAAAPITGLTLLPRRSRGRRHLARRLLTPSPEQRGRHASRQPAQERQLPAMVAVMEQQPLPDQIAHAPPPPIR